MNLNKDEDEADGNKLQDEEIGWLGKTWEIFVSVCEMWVGEKL